MEGRLPGALPPAGTLRADGAEAAPLWRMACPMSSLPHAILCLQVWSPKPRAPAAPTRVLPRERPSTQRPLHGPGWGRKACRAGPRRGTTQAHRWSVGMSREGGGASLPAGSLRGREAVWPRPPPPTASGCLRPADSDSMALGGERGEVPSPGLAARTDFFSSSGSQRVPSPSPCELSRSAQLRATPGETEAQRG